MSRREIMRMRSATEGIDVVLEEADGARVTLVLDFWRNGSREAADLTASDLSRLSTVLRVAARSLREVCWECGPSGIAEDGLCRRHGKKIATHEPT